MFVNVYQCLSMFINVVFWIVFGTSAGSLSAYYMVFGSSVCDANAMVQRSLAGQVAVHVGLGWISAGVPGFSVGTGAPLLQIDTQ